MGTLTGASLRQGTRTGRLTALTESNVHVAWEGRFGPEEQILAKNQLPESLEILMLDGGWKKLSESLVTPKKESRSETTVLIEELQQITEKKHTPWKYQSSRGPGPSAPGYCAGKKYPECKGNKNWKNKEDSEQNCWDCRKVGKYTQRCVRKKPRDECDGAKVKTIRVNKCWKCGYNAKYKQEKGLGPAHEKRQRAKEKLKAARTAARKGAVSSIGKEEKTAAARKAEARRARTAKRQAARERIAAAKEKARRGSIAGMG